MAIPSVTTATSIGSKSPMPPPPLPPPPLRAPSIADTRLATMMRLWPAPRCAPNAYDEKQSLAVRMHKDTQVAQDQLYREGKLMTFKVGLERINAIFDRAIQNKMRVRLPPPPLPPRLP